MKLSGIIHTKTSKSPGKSGEFRTGAGFWPTLVHLHNTSSLKFIPNKKWNFSKIEDKLKSISYPFISNVNDELLKPDVKRSSDSDAQEKHLHLIKQENENILRFCLDCLLDIELMPLLVELACKKELKQRFSGLADRISNKSAIVEILAKPFETRFTYHFMGARKTNNYEKPEWYLQQVFKWIKGHDEWINSFIQPIFDNYKLYKGRPILVSVFFGSLFFEPMHSGSVFYCNYLLRKFTRDVGKLIKLSIKSSSYCLKRIHRIEKFS